MRPMEDDALVFVIFDPQYGDQARELLKDGSVWIVASSANDAAVGRLSMAGDTVDTVTLFEPEQSVAARLSSLLPQIAQHHEDCGIAVPRTLASPRVRTVLQRAGYAVFVERELGGEWFVLAKRQSR